MQPFFFVFNLLLKPFELLGQLLALVPFLLGKLLRSPWGLLVPCTIIAAVFLSSHLSRNPDRLAESYLANLKTCEEREILTLLEALVQLDESGIPPLAKALRLPRAAVFSATRQTLGNELERWESLDDAERFRRYRILSQSLLEQVRTFDDEGQDEAIRFCRRMLRNLALSQTTGQALEPDLRAVSRNCERLLSAMETRRKKMLAPDGPQNRSTAETVARQEGRAFDPTLMASMGRPFTRAGDAEVSNPEKPETGIADAFAAPRLEQLHAYHESPRFQQQLAAPYRRPGMVGPPTRHSGFSDESNLQNPPEMVAAINPVRGLPTAAESMPQGKIADSYTHPERGIPSGIARNYLEIHAEHKAAPVEAPEKTSEIENGGFLPFDLRRISLERIATLSSSRLMRLLQHPDERYVSEARKTLIARDGFRDSHLKLAYRLFHPEPSVREEIVDLLPNTTGVQPRMWFSVLLDDPNGDVRYRAASFLATTGDPTMQRLLIDRGKRDPDSRIVNLADRLLEQQRHRVRR